jgi:tetratricopeptide (TPR) repeat protein
VTPFLSRKKPIKGEIGYFSLGDWWLATFSDEERKHIVETTRLSLTSGETPWMEESAVWMLQGLAGWFAKEGERHIAYRMLEKAEELSKELPIASKTAVLDCHFLYDQEINLYYKDRDKPQYLEKAIEDCKKQIALAPKAATAFKAEFKADGFSTSDGLFPLPGHKGYEQLAIILEKQNNYKEAIEVCTQAEKQGWYGDWENRTERCKKKLAKQ